MFNWLLELFYWIIWIFSYLISWKSIFVIALMLVKLMTSSSVWIHYSAPKISVWPHKSLCFDVPNITQCIQKGEKLYVNLPYGIKITQLLQHSFTLHEYMLFLWALSLQILSVSWNWLRIVGRQWRKDSLGVNRINGIWENVKKLFRHQLIASV